MLNSDHCVTESEHLRRNAEYVRKPWSTVVDIGTNYVQ